MNENLEQKAQKYYDSRKSQEDIAGYEKQGLRTEGATIKEAYFGRQSKPSWGRELPFGLNVSVDFDYSSASQFYSDMETISGLMNELDVNRPEEMVGKRVIGYFSKDGMRLVALSVEKGDEK